MEYAASISAPQLERGLIAAAFAPMQTPTTISRAEHPERVSTRLGTVGIRVGITTPDAEDTQDITPASRVIIALAVLGPISSESISESISEVAEFNIGDYGMRFGFSVSDLKLSIDFSGFDAVDSIQVPDPIAAAKQ